MSYRFVFIPSNDTTLIRDHLVHYLKQGRLKKMWFKVDDINLVGKKIVERDSFHLMISDYKHVWSKSIHDNEVISIVKVSAKKLIISYYLLQ